MQPCKRRLSWLIGVLIVVGCSNVSVRGEIVYVDEGAVGQNDGSSWSNAFVELQDALAMANVNDQVWVAAGTYRPSRVSGDERATFRLRNGIAVYGGFSGNETDLAARDPATQPTILSGDIDDDDILNQANNSFHVVTASGTDATAVLDGFVIRAGNAIRAFPDDEGAGMYIVRGSPTVRACVFRDNKAFSGAGLFNREGSPTLANCAFIDNISFASGGGMHNVDASAVLSETAFRGNTAGGFGGGLYNFGNGSPTLTACSISNNTANTRGGGVYSGGTGSPAFTQCEFVGNISDEGGGVFALSSSLLLRDCLLTDNVAHSSGGGLSFISGSPRFESCQFVRNTAGDGGGATCLDGSPIFVDCAFLENRADSTGGGLASLECTASVQESEFRGNTARDGGALYNLSGQSTVRECVFHGNTAELSGGAVSNDASNALIVACSLSDNTVLSLSGDGGAIWNVLSDSFVTNCSLRGNAAARGGGMSNLASSPTLTNVVFNDNSASFGGAIFNDASVPSVTNVTVSGNEAGVGGGIASFNGTRVTLTNSILWGNKDSLGIVRFAQLYSEDSTNLVNYTCIEGLSGTLGGVGNTNRDPLFVDPDGDDDVRGTADDNLQLSPGAPCNDSGDSSAVTRDAADIDNDHEVTEATPLALEGHPRFLDDPLAPDQGRGPQPRVDMGAFEHLSPVRFVRLGATGASNGKSWTDAYVDLQDALAEAHESGGAITAIWVASGTYAPGDAESGRSASFRLVQGVSVYGGFAGNETGLTQRDPTVNRTVLSGDLLGDDLPGFGSTIDNAFHVVTADNVGAGTLLDGFVIRGGRADEDCDECLATGGGGLLLINSHLRLVGCEISENLATVGGGIVINGGAPVLIRCTISGNVAIGAGSTDVGGGGIVTNGSNPLLTNCRLLGNSTPLDGGGMYVLGASAPKLVNCALSGNSAGGAGGAMLVLGGRPTLSNCTFSGNRAESSGGGLANALNGRPIIDNCVLWGNEDSGGYDESAQVHTTSATAVVNYSCLQGWTGILGGSGNLGGDPELRDVDGSDDQLGTDDDDLRLRSTSPCIDAGDNARVAADVADLDRDGNILEATPIDLAGNGRFIDVPSVADSGANPPPVVDMGAFEHQPDCNGNGIVDASDIAKGHSHDCNFNGQPDECDILTADCDGNDVPDDCQTPQIGSVMSRWGGTAGVWNTTPINPNWCLPESPNNNETTTFDVIIGGPESIVTLNTSPTIASLSLEAGAKLVVNDASGANVRTLAVDGPIMNGGVLRATDRERLVLDAPEIDQGGSCGLGGTIEAVDGQAGNDESSDRSVIEINGSRVLGGVVRAVEGHSEVHLIGGAELVDCCAEGVIVPDGQTGRFSGTVLNHDVLRIEGMSDTTRLEPGTGSPALAGAGSVRLTSQTFSRLGDFKNSFVNSAGHHIEGQGIVFGGLMNLGTLHADVPGAHLILFPPGQKRNDGEFRASNGATLRIAATVGGNGTYLADGGTILLAPAGELVSLAGSQLAVRGEVFCGGRLGIVEITEDAGVELSGPVDVDVAGVVSLLDSSSLTTSGAVRLNGGEGMCCCPCDSVVSTVAGGQTPPVLKITGTAQLTSSSILLTGKVESFNSSAGPVSVSGAFDNRSTCPQSFEWLEGTLRLNGLALQTSEAAGHDSGPDIAGYQANFAIGRLEIGEGAHVEVIDAFDNQQDGVASESSYEALYVGALVLEADSRFETAGGRVYYCELHNDGGSIAQLGKSVMRIHADANCDRAIDLADYATMYPCLIGPPSSDCLELFDVNADADVDLKDFARFQTLVGK